MISIDPDTSDLIMEGLSSPEPSRSLPLAVAELFAAHLNETDEYRGCWVDDLSNVSVQREHQGVIVLAYCHWARSSRGPIYADPCMARFGEENGSQVAYELCFAAPERATREAGGHIRYEPSAHWTWEYRFRGSLPASH